MSALGPLAVALAPVLAGCSPIGIASVPHRKDVNDLRIVVDLVQHAIIANSNPPQPLLTLELPTARRSWIIDKPLNPSQHARHQACFERLKFTSRRSRKLIS